MTKVDAIGSPSVSSWRIQLPAVGPAQHPSLVTLVLKQCRDPANAGAGQQAGPSGGGQVGVCSRGGSSWRGHLECVPQAPPRLRPALGPRSASHSVQSPRCRSLSGLAARDRVQSCRQCGTRDMSLTVPWPAPAAGPPGSPPAAKAASWPSMRDPAPLAGPCQ